MVLHRLAKPDPSGCAGSIPARDVFKMEKKKRGQVTIFIIIAILVIALVAGFFLFREQLGLEDIFTPKGDEVYLFVEECIEGTGKDAIYHIAENGGYMFPPQLSTLGGIAYYYFEGKNYMPSEEDVENQLSLYMDYQLSACTQDFVNFPDYNISEGEIETSTSIRDSKVIFDVKYPLTIKKGKETRRLENFGATKISTGFGVVYNSINELIQNQLKREDICLSCIADIALERDLIIDMTSTEQGEIIFIITDENLKINDIPLEWVFANKY